jgi:hypothetical protein
VGPEYKDCDISNWFGMLTPFGVPMTIPNASLRATPKLWVIRRSRARSCSRSSAGRQHTGGIRCLRAKIYAQSVELTDVRLAPCAAHPPPKRSNLQQDRQGLFVGDPRAGLELWQGATADGVPDHQEGITRQTQHACNIARRHLEGLGAQHHRSLAELFETNAVVQTAR